MVSKKVELNISKTYNVYILSSLIASFIDWCFLYYSRDNFLNQSFFPSTLLVMTYYLYSFGELGRKRQVINLFFLFQIFCFLGTGIFFESSINIFMAFIPCSASFVYQFFINSNFDDSRKIKGVMLTCSAFSIWFFLDTFSDTQVFSTLEKMQLMLLGVWFITLCYYGTKYFFKAQRMNYFKLVRHFKNKKHDNNEESYFFNDLINLTHAPVLFLQNKISLGESVNSKEAKFLIDQIRATQSMINQFSGNNNYFIRNDNATDYFKSLMDSFLPSNYVQKEFIWKSSLDHFEIEYSVLVRVFTNLLKNAAESHSKNVSIEFDFKTDGVHLTMKSQIFEGEDRYKKSAEYLKSAILNEKENLKKIDEDGLDSVKYLCEEFSGSFNYHISGEYWINSVFIPYKSSSKQVNFAA